MTEAAQGSKQPAQGSKQPAQGVTEDGLPPGPKGPSLLQTLRFLRRTVDTFPALHRRYGDTFTIRMLPGPRNLVVFSRPEDIKEIFAGDPADFHAGEGNAILRPVMGRNSVLLTDDDTHMRARKLLMPAFNGASLRGYGSLVEAIAKNEVDGWTDGETLVTLDRMNALTLEVILQVVFGVTDERRLAGMRPMVRRMVNINSTMLIGWMYPKLFNVPPWRSYFQNQTDFDTLLYREIAERRAATDLDGRDDVLSRLLRVGRGEDFTHDQLSDVELRDQLVTLLLAGHETTASALSWTLHELGRNADLQAQALRAADEGDGAFLEACLKEAMRLHPIIDMVVRALQSDQVVAGWHLPKGTTVAASIVLSHNREENFADAHVYRPSRFLDERIEPNTWIPFGGGVRRCIGAGFSLMEGTVALREILQRYRFEAAVPAPNRLRNITNVPGDKAPLQLNART